MKLVTKLNTKLGRTAMIAAIGGAALGVLIGANLEHVWSDGMLRDGSIGSMLSPETRQALASARPLRTRRVWSPNGAEHYIINGQPVPVVTTLVRVGCAPGGPHTLCGVTAGDVQDDREDRPDAAIGFSVIDGQLVTYSAGDARKHPERYRTDVEELAARQIAAWRDEERITGTGDSL